MPRPRLTDDDRRQGRALGAALGAQRRHLNLTAEAVAIDLKIHLDTLRQLECGRVANPGVFTVAVLAERLGLRLDDLARDARSSNDGPEA